MKEITPKVTVACITYNHAPYIMRCLEGIFMQVCDFDFEVIIHDDLSLDGTQDIIKEYVRPYKDKVRLIFQEVNQYSQGKKPLIDFILPLARGKYIAFCEGDDYWTDPQKLQKQVDFLEQHKELSFCSHNINRIDGKGNVIKKGSEKTENIFYNDLEVLHNYFPPLSILFRNKPLNYTSELLTAFNGDVVLITLLSKYGGAANLGFVGGNYRIHDGGIYSKKSLIENTIKSILTRKKLLNYGALSQKQIKELKKNIVYRRNKALKYSIRNLKFTDVFRLLSI